jgi:two-component system NtrC family sensor kinase
MLKLNLILPSNFFTDNITLIGSASEVILLSLALGNRINILKREKAQAEHIKQVIENEQLVRE